MVQIVNMIEYDIENVVASFSLNCRINLRHIALHGSNVEYFEKNAKRRETIVMRLRKPNLTANITAKNVLINASNTSEAEAKLGARKVARCIQKMFPEAKFHNYKMISVSFNVSLPFRINIIKLAASYPEEGKYEPEICPSAAIFKIKILDSTLKIYTNGNCCIYCKNSADIKPAMDYIVPILHSHKIA